MSALPPSLSAARARAWAWWILPVVALGLLIGLETDWGRQIVRVPSSPPPVEPKAITPAVLPDYQIAGGLPAHAETVERTLFNATRRPAPVLAADSGPGVLKPGQFQLMGTAVSGDHNVAFLKELAGGKTKAVRQGEKINGLLVASIQPDRVKFTLGGDSEELLLKVAPGPKTTIAAAPPAPGAASPGAAPVAAAQARAAAAQAAANAAASGAVAQPAQNARAARRAARQTGGSQRTDPGSGSTQGMGSQGGNQGAGRNR